MDLDVYVDNNIFHVNSKMNMSKMHLYLSCKILYVFTKDS